VGSPVKGESMVLVSSSFLTGLLERCLDVCELARQVGMEEIGQLEVIRREASSHMSAGESFADRAEPVVGSESGSLPPSASELSSFVERPVGELSTPSVGSEELGCTKNESGSICVVRKRKTKRFRKRKRKTGLREAGRGPLSTDVSSDSDGGVSSVAPLVAMLFRKQYWSGVSQRLPEHPSLRKLLSMGAKRFLPIAELAEVRARLGTDNASLFQGDSSGPGITRFLTIVRSVPRPQLSRQWMDIVDSLGPASVPGVGSSQFTVSAADCLNSPRGQVLRREAVRLASGSTSGRLKLSPEGFAEDCVVGRRCHSIGSPGVRFIVRRSQAES